ncbi:MAG: thiamine biosynthesis lipoprotein [Halioglobus sp.]|jgi:thiamine biosynthesis lipoprotein
MISAAKIRSHSIGWFFFAVALSVLLVSGCSSEQKLVRLSGATMGTTWHVSYVPSDEGVQVEALQQEIDAILAAVNRSMSTYLADSEISSVNAAPLGQWTTVSDEFYFVLTTALSIGQHSQGAYDVTIAPLVDRWGFGPTFSQRELPTGDEIKSLLSQVGQEKLRLDASYSALKKLDEVALDFSSLAKGYAVDRVADWLGSQSIENYLVEVGGEIRLSGHSQRGDHWRVAIEQPKNGSRGVAQALSLTDVAVATSGDYRNFFERDGKRYSHSIDARTGYPVEHDLVSVTVVHERAMLADGWATALIVLGSNQALELAQEQGLAVYFIQRQDDEYLNSHTEAFEPYLQRSMTRE